MFPTKNKLKKLSMKNGFPILKNREPKDTKSKIGTQTIYSVELLPNELPSTKEEYDNKDLNKDLKALTITSEYIPDLIKIIKSDKNLPDLFGPLKKTKVQLFINSLQKVFKNGDIISKVPAPVIGILKNYAYIRKQKGSDRKFIPETNGLIDIICCGYLYYISIQLNISHEKLIEIIERNYHVDKSQGYDFLNYIYKLNDLMYIVNNQNLNQLVEDELNSFDIRVKYLRAIQYPSMDNLMGKIVEIISETNLDDNLKEKVYISKGKFKTENQFLLGRKVSILVKKIGIRYINSRSNLEWYLYGSTLKRIRNLLTREKSAKFMSILLFNVKSFKEKLRQEVGTFEDSVPVYKNLLALEIFLEKDILQKQKQYN